MAPPDPVVARFEAGRSPALSFGALVTAPDLSSPDTYVGGPPHEVFAELRRTQPVYWQEMASEPGYWAVLTHADVVRVATQPNLFSAEQGGVVLENLAPEQLAMMRNMLLAMDPPRHFGHRRPLVQSFKPAAIGAMEGGIRSICRSIMAAVAGSGIVDIVQDVAAKLPSQVIGELMGLPREDWALIHRLAEMNTSSQDPDLAASAESRGSAGEDVGPAGAGASIDVGTAGDVGIVGDVGTVGDVGIASDSGRVGEAGAGGGARPSTAASSTTEPGSASMEMAMYAIRFAMARRAAPPQDDLTSLILQSDFGGAPMSDLDFGSFFVQLVTAGNDTTKTMLAAGLQVLLDHPDQLAALRTDPSLIPGAVEEILRYANPLHYFRRTATGDTELHGVSIAAGDKVVMMYTSANRDEAVFADPDRFDIRRDPNPHLSFGFGEHHCLGIHLARLEGRVFFEELLAAFPTIEVAGEVTRVRSNLNNALKRFPVRLA